MLFNGLAKIQIASSMASGQAVLNTFYVSDTALGHPPALADLSGLCTDLHTFLGTQYRAVLTTGDTLVEYRAYQVADPTDPEPVLEASDAIALAGTRTVSSDPSPQSLCALLSLKTPNASRRFRGHLFMPPAKDASALIADGFKPSQAYMVAVNALQTKFRAGNGPTPTWTGTTLSNYGLVVYSHRAASLGDPSVALTNNVTNNASAHWLRSRERGTT